MNIQTRLCHALNSRIKALLPEIHSSLWKNLANQCKVENLRVTPDGSAYENWQRVAELKGTLRVDLNTDQYAALPLEVLIVDLHNNPITLLPQNEERISHAGHATLSEWRDVDDHLTAVVQLYFTVEVALCTILKPCPQPVLAGIRGHITNEYASVE